MEKLLRKNPLSLLFSLAREGALERKLKASTKSMAQKIKVSQQTTSRWLVQLSKSGFVERGFGWVKLTEKAKREMKGLFAIAIKEEKTEGKGKEVVAIGEVISGMQDGKKFLSMREYAEKVRDTSSYFPYPGTLNLKLIDEKSVRTKEILQCSEGKRIAGFEKNGRTFGGARLFPGIIWKKGREEKSEICAAIIPDSTHYGTRILEIISEKHLRKALNLKNGDTAEVRIN